MISNNDEKSWSSYDFQQILKNFTFEYLPKNYILTNFHHRGSTNQFSGQKLNFKMNRVLSFFKNFSKLSQNFEILLKFFLKSWNFLRVFIVFCHLQFVGASIGFYRTSLTLLAQEKRSAENGQKRFLWHFFSKNFLIGFYQKSTIIDLPYSLTSAMVNTCQNLSVLEKKVKNHKKICQKSWHFRKIWLFWLHLLRISGDLF